MSKKMDGSDRRRFFRIDDRLQIGIARLQDVQDAERHGAGGRGNVLLDIDRRITAIVASARLQAPAVAELAELLNRKLNHVIDTLRLNEEIAHRASFREFDVSLSACGLGFALQDYYEPDTWLVVDLMLPPREDYLRVVARVVRCLEQNNGAWLLHLEFAEIPEDDQEELIQYILRRQSAYLHGLREKRDYLRSRPVG